MQDHKLPISVSKQSELTKVTPKTSSHSVRQNNENLKRIFSSTNSQFTRNNDNRFSCKVNDIQSIPMPPGTANGMRLSTKVMKTEESLNDTDLNTLSSFNFAKLFN